MQTFTMVAILMTIAIFLAMAARKLHLPYAVALVLAGMAMALFPALPPGFSDIRLEPHLAMAVFLPPLLVASAYFTPLRDFRRNLRPILLLAVGLVAFTTLSIAGVTKLVFPNLPWAMCFAFGALISPPDAAAATAVLQAVRMPRRIVTLLEGESLLNDATGLVLYNFAIAAMLTGGFSVWHAGASFLWLAAGGLATGWGTAWVAGLLGARLQDPLLEITGGFLTAFASFAIAEAIGASGVLAAVAYGLTIAWHAPEWMTARSRISSNAVWAFAVFVLNTVVFTMIGLELRGVFERFGGLPPLWFVGNALLISAALIVVRFVWTFPVAYGHRWLFPSIRRVDPYPPWRHTVVVCWAGMRGVVSMAAALAIPENLPGRDLVLALTFFAIFVTLVVQGTTLGPLVRLLGLSGHGAEAAAAADAPVRRRLAEEAVRHLATQSDDEIVGPFARDLSPFFGQRVEAERLREQNPAAADAERVTLLRLKLDALAAQRALLTRLYRAREVDDHTMRLLTDELDLDELRLRRPAEQHGA